MSREIVQSYPVDSEGRRLYRCLACGRIFHEDEEPCGVGCPTGYEDAWGLANEDIEYEYVEETRVIDDERDG